MPALETQVNVLASLITRLATVREVSAGNLPVHLRSAITNVSSFAEELASSEVQDALATAETEQNLKATDLQNSRREIKRQRKQVNTAPPAKRPTTKTYPYPPRATGQTDGVLTRDNLSAFVENFNRVNSNASVSIWTPTDSVATQHSTLRIVVPNVLVGYISLRDGRGQDNSLKPDSVSVAGIREQRAASEFAVFRLISQYIFKIMAENQGVAVPDLVYRIKIFIPQHVTNANVSARYRTTLRRLFVFGQRQPMRIVTTSHVLPLDTKAAQPVTPKMGRSMSQGLSYSSFGVPQVARWSLRNSFTPGA
ncbi:hypothetical protein FRC10_011273 [Ceratobasidium sp. 414]|nr:hypothetical protein FRC10_011273 [Ceratobasidium sp. 414]